MGLGVGSFRYYDARGNDWVERTGGGEEDQMLKKGRQPEPLISPHSTNNTQVHEPKKLFRMRHNLGINLEGQWSESPPERFEVALFHSMTVLVLNENGTRTRNRRRRQNEHRLLLSTSTGTRRFFDKFNPNSKIAQLQNPSDRAGCVNGRLFTLAPT